MEHSECVSVPLREGKPSISLKLLMGSVRGRWWQLTLLAVRSRERDAPGDGGAIASGEGPLSI